METPPKRKKCVGQKEGKREGKVYCMPLRVLVGWQPENRRPEQLSDSVRLQISPRGNIKASPQQATGSKE